MGLIRGLVLLPLAPVRGVVWLAERITEVAERELDDEPAMHRHLMELRTAHELGEVSDEDYEIRQDELLARLEAARRRERGEEPW